MITLNDKSVIITGGASGLGLASAIAAAEAGARLTPVDVNADALATAAEKVKAAAPEAEALTVVADVTDEAAVQNHVDEHVKAYGGIHGVGNQSGYSASKHGVVGLTRNSAVEYGDKGVVINAVAPGAFMTDMVEGSLKQMGGENWEEVGRQFVSANPMKRFGKPEELGQLVVFLLSNAAGFINGTVIPIDGGQHAKY